MFEKCDQTKTDLMLMAFAQILELQWLKLKVVQNEALLELEPVAFV